MLINLCRTRLYIRSFNCIRLYSTNRTNHYEVLGITKTATTQEIKQAFYSLSKQNHPDIVGAESKLFLEIKDAYETLKDETKRQIYDSKLNYDFSAPKFEETLRERRRSYEYKTGDPMSENRMTGNYESIELSSQYGHFYDPNMQFEIIKRNRKSIIIGSFIFIVILAALMNLWRMRLDLRRFAVTRCFSSGTRNYYDVLGISKTATSKEIKEAFYALSKKYHPDVVGSDSKRFLEVKEAYDTLKDEEKRRVYDSGFNAHGYDPFSQQRPQSDFSRSGYRSVRRDYEFRTNRHYTQEEIDRIWKQFQEQIRNKMNAEYDERTRREARDKHYNDYIKSRTYRWQQHADTHEKMNPYNNPQYRQGWNIFNRVLAGYFVIFVLVAIFRTLFGPMNETEVKHGDGRTFVAQKYGNQSYNYEDSRDRLKQMMVKPPMDTRETPQIDPNYPYGIPQSTARK